jgi:hypothetical protein
VPARGAGQHVAVERDRGIRVARAAQQRVGDDGAGERALDRLLHAARGDRVDGERRVAQADRVRSDRVGVEMRRGVDRRDRPVGARAAPPRHEPRPLEKGGEARIEAALRLGAERRRVDEGEDVAAAVGKGHAPEPGILAGLDPRPHVRRRAAPVAMDGEHARRRPPARPARAAGPPARIGEEVAGDRRPAAMRVDVERPARSFAPAGGERGGLEHAHAIGTRAIEQQGVEDAAIDEHPLRARILAQALALVPGDLDRARPGKARRLDHVARARRFEERQDAGRQRFAKMAAREGAALDEHQLVPEPRHPRGEAASRGAAADDADPGHGPPQADISILPESRR